MLQFLDRGIEDHNIWGICSQSYHEPALASYVFALCFIERKKTSCTSVKINYGIWK